MEQPPKVRKKTVHEFQVGDIVRFHKETTLWRVGIPPSDSASPDLLFLENRLGTMEANTHELEYVGQDTLTGMRFETTVRVGDIVRHRSGQMAKVDHHYYDGRLWCTSLDKDSRSFLWEEQDVTFIGEPFIRPAGEKSKKNTLRRDRSQDYSYDKTDISHSPAPSHVISTADLIKNEVQELEKAQEARTTPLRSRGLQTRTTPEIREDDPPLGPFPKRTPKW